MADDPTLPLSRECRAFNVNENCLRLLAYCRFAKWVHSHCSHRPGVLRPRPDLSALWGAKRHLGEIKRRELSSARCIREASVQYRRKLGHPPAESDPNHHLAPITRFLLAAQGEIYSARFSPPGLLLWYGLDIMSSRNHFRSISHLVPHLCW